MFRILIIAEGNKRVEGLSYTLTKRGYSCSLATDGQNIAERIAEHAPDLILFAGNGHPRIKELTAEIKRDTNLPVFAVVDADGLNTVDGQLDLVDDFVTSSARADELELRVKRLLLRTKSPGEEQIKSGDLMIDLEKCEVLVDRRPILLTFKEYELLKCLAGKPGHVFTRDALLNRVWGYEYYGGDRTVDVHIKRLRSKIEDANHTFIETVRNIGYRFRADL
ncbi:MAG: response regulator transcription factor [Dehalococcoidales bacterium]|nr:response regulator transcription factor [Dehalococcoidales bacterium]